MCDLYTKSQRISESHAKYKDITTSKLHVFWNQNTNVSSIDQSMKSIRFFPFFVLYEI